MTSWENPASKTIEWYTPPEVFETLGITFDLDVASPIIRCPWIPARYSYDVVDDGLTSEWFGRVWMNPPYGKHIGSVEKWIRRFVDHGDGVALTPSRTDAKWFHDLAPKVDALIFKQKRIKFLRPTDTGYEPGPTPGAGSMLWALGSESVEAIKRIDGLFVLLREPQMGLPWLRSS